MGPVPGSGAREGGTPPQPRSPPTHRNCVSKSQELGGLELMPSGPRHRPAVAGLGAGAGRGQGPECFRGLSCGRFLLATGRVAGALDGGSFSPVRWQICGPTHGVSGMNGPGRCGRRCLDFQGALRPSQWVLAPFRLTRFPRLDSPRFGTSDMPWAATASRKHSSACRTPGGSFGPRPPCLHPVPGQAGPL